MKRTIYLAVITLITIGCVLFGVYRFTNGNFVFSIGNANYSTEESATLEAFERISVDAAVMDLIVKEGTDYSLDYHATENLVMSYHVENGKLIISQKKKGSMNGINNAVMTLTVPAETQLERMDIKVDVGDVNVMDLDIVNMDVDLDVGDTTIERTTLEKGVIDGDTGDVELKDSSFVNLDISSDVGDVKVHSSIDISGYSYDLKTDVGEVEVGAAEYGKKYFKDGEMGKIFIHGDVGDITVGD